MARLFNGTTGRIGFTPVATSSWGSGLTIATIVRRNSANNYHTMYYRGTSGGFGAGTPAFGINNSNVMYLEVGAASTTGITVAAGHWLLAVTKATGTSTPRFHAFDLDTPGSWTHSNGGATVGDPATAVQTIEEIGRWNGTSGDYWDGDIACLGVWHDAMDDGEIESLLLGFAQWKAKPGLQRLYHLHQADVADTIIDLAGTGSNEINDTGTSVATVSTPSWSWGFAPTVAGVAAGSGPVTVNLTQPSETDTGAALVNTKALTLGQPSETDSAQASTLTKVVTLGQASETSSSAALTVTRGALTLTQPTETDSGQALAPTKLVALGQASEMDSTAALAVTRGALTLGQTTEADSALALVPTKAPATGQPSDTETSAAVTVTKTVTLGQAVEADEAFPLTTDGSVNVALEQATETDTGQPLVFTKVVTLGRATEVDTALPVSVGSASAVQLAQAAEADSTAALVASKVVTLGRATEVDTALALVISGAELPAAVGINLPSSHTPTIRLPASHVPALAFPARYDNEVRLP